MEKITENVHVGMTFRSCNTSYVVTSDGVVVIDTPMVPSEAKQYREEILKHGDIKYVINNEPHPDHIAGNCWMGGTLVGQEGTREAILKVSREFLEHNFKMMAPDALPLPKEFYFRTPDITFSSELTIYLGRHTFHLFHVPGHTPSETAVYVPEERVLFTSDNVVVGMPIMFQAVPRGWLKSLERLQKLDFDKVVPGHGPVQDKSYLKVMHDNVAYYIDQIEAAIAKGWSLEQTKEKVTFAERWPLPPGDPMKVMRHESIEHAYEVLKNKK
jgi:cyclase